MLSVSHYRHHSVLLIDVETEALRGCYLHVITKIVSEARSEHWSLLTMQHSSHYAMSIIILTKYHKQMRKLCLLEVKPLAQELIDVRARIQTKDSRG